MSTLIDADGYELVDESGLTYTEGCAPPCCTPPPANHYYRFEACDAPSLDPCSATGPVPGLEEIFVADHLVCQNSGLTVREHVILALGSSGQPVIQWAGWCYRFAGACYFPSCPQPNPNPCGLACNVLPVNAQGPAGGVYCTNGCGAPCGGPQYVFFKRCPGQPPTGPAPEYYLCFAQLSAFFAAGGRCPVFALEGFGCWYADWTNASPTRPANYQQYNGSPSHDGCCTCLGPPCVSAEVHTGCFGATILGGNCCAHAEQGAAVVEWEFVARFNGAITLRKAGRAERHGLVLTGSWTREVPGQSETFGISGVFSTSSMFGVVRTLTPDTIASLAEKTWLGFPCVGTLFGTATQTVQSSCTRFTMTGQANDGAGTTTQFSVTYTCEPNPGVCATGCPGNGVSPPPPATDPTAPNPIGGDGMVIGEGGDAWIDDAARRQLGHVCTGCG